MGKPSKERTAYFSVGSSTELHAQVWRLWAPLGNSDVYLAPRFSGESKLSIHGSGVRHFRGASAKSRTQTPAGEWLAADDPGEWRWKAPERVAPGVEIVWRVVTPANELSVARLDPRFKAGVTWIPTGPQNSAVELLFFLSFGLFFREGEWPLSDVFGGRCLVRWPLANGETLFVVGRIAPLEQGHRDWFDAERARMGFPDGWQDDMRSFDYRCLVLLDRSDAGFIGCFDLAWRPARRVA
ncbi:MAG TPA: hypothetical protein VFD71_15065 [Planctomycetota bacterium]|nr:hypothetical protein [Planctomycetota bacterium]